ncbi:COMM domain [Trinorchestia longiramus]|nr:COMM domain [Trinorchestia longiramus]
MVKAVLNYKSKKFFIKVINMDKTMGQTVLANSFSRPRTIFTTRLPSDVQTLLSAASKLDKSSFRKLIKVGLAHLQSQQTELECEAAFDSICSALKCDSYNDALSLAEQYSGLLTLLRALLSLNAATVRQQHLQFDLESLGLRAEQASDLSRVVYGPSRPAINRQLQLASPRLPALTHVDWSLRLALAPPSVAHVVEPVIALELHTTDRTSPDVLALSVSRFHELRLTVANVLHHMEALRTLPGAARPTDGDMVQATGSPASYLRAPTAPSENKEAA